MINTSMTAELDKILTGFEPYYETGIAMATAFIEEGPADGNALMASFDATAATINEEVDAFVVFAQEETARIINTLETNY